MIVPRVAPWKTTAKGLVACWPFYDGSGPEVRDVSGYGFDLPTIGSPPWVDQPGWPRPQGLSLNGSSQYGQLGAANLLNFTNTQPFSVTAWIYLPALSTTQDFTIASTLDPSNNYIGWEFSISSGSGEVGCPYLFAINNYGAGNYMLPIAETPISADVPSCVAFTYTGGSKAADVQFYLNAVPLTIFGSGSDNLSGSTQSAVGLTLGARRGPSNEFTGNIGETRIYNRMLAPSEVADIYLGRG